MKDTLLFLSTPLVAGVILAGLLGYFGTHILSRGIIFIDIALAQVAALGAMIGLLLGFAEESTGGQFASYALTLLVITGFALLRAKDLFIPPEAVIGIIYCLTLALALLMAEKIPQGSHYITKTIAGNLLWVTWNKVLRLALLFAGLLLIHFIFGKDFIWLTDHASSQSGRSARHRFSNLLFYLFFGVVVVKAVMIGGIFLVFSLLIAPSAAAAMYCNDWKGRLIWSWIIGLTVTVAGILASYYLNLSNGPAIVCLLGILVILLALLKLTRPALPG
jgi:zinc/manganese transport system permease protein